MTSYMIKRVFSILAFCSVCLLCVAQQSTMLQAFFPVGSSRLNTFEMAPGFADSVRAANAAGAKYTLWGVASPEGGYQRNVRLAQRRADAILSEVVRQTGLPASLFQTRTRVMDAADMLSLARQDESLPDRDRVISILEEGASIPVTLHKLKQLDGGTPYLYIKRNLFPYLRASLAANTDSLVYRPSLTAGLQPVITPVTSTSIPTRNAVAQNTELRHSAEIKDTPSAPQESKIQNTDTSAAQVVPLSADTVAPEPGNSEIPVSKAAEPQSSPSRLPYWLAIALLLALVVGIIVYYRRRVADLDDQLADARMQNDIMKREYEEKMAAEAQKWSAEVEKAKTEAIREAKDEALKSMYNDGETLCNHLLIGGTAKDWTTEQIRTFIGYYKVRNFALVNSLETEYDGLTPNQILFEILVDMGMSDSDIQRVMGISQTTIRSNRFRIKAKKRQ